jgi:hypothetical protein
MLPVPDSKNYSIFHLLWKKLPNDNFHKIVGILTTLVSFDNSDHGKVIYKDSLILSGFYNGGFNAVRHGNGRDWWIVIKDEYSASINIYLLDPTGIKLFKKYNESEKLIKNHSYPVSYFSPNGEHYVSVDNMGINFDSLRISIYNFDRCHGNILKKESKLLLNSLLIHGEISFSPDGHYLYATDRLNMYQYDMFADEILE